MMGSPAIKPNADECAKWEKTLVTVQAVIEEWLRVQRAWLYLQPIFGSDDIARQLPSEHRRFQGVDALYRRTMQEARDRPRALEAAGRESLLTTLREAGKVLDVIAKGLNDYLETKRMVRELCYQISIYKSGCHPSNHDGLHTADLLSLTFSPVVKIYSAGLPPLLLPVR